MWGGGSNLSCPDGQGGGSPFLLWGGPVLVAICPPSLSSFWPSIRLLGIVFFSLLSSSLADCCPSVCIQVPITLEKDDLWGWGFSSVWSLSTETFFFFLKETLKRLHLHFELKA